METPCSFVESGGLLKQKWYFLMTKHRKEARRMGVYIKEFAPIYGCEGQQMLSLLIEHSFKTKSVLFEVYRNNEKWMLYWRFEVSIQDIIMAAQKCKYRGKSLVEAVEDSDVRLELRKISPAYRCMLEAEDVSMINDLLQKGIKEDVPKTQGLDGHSYIVRLAGDEKEYRCWCILPKEWLQLESVITCLVKKADLSDEYLVSGIA